MFETTDVTKSSGTTFKITIKTCYVCKKRSYIEEYGLMECNYCFHNYWNRKMYRCHCPSFISNKWLRIAYRLKIPYWYVHKIYGGLRFI